MHFYKAAGEEALVSHNKDNKKANIQNTVMVCKYPQNIKERMIVN